LISIHSKFPNIDPSANENAALRMASMNGHLPVIQYLISIHEQFPKILLGIEKAIEEAENSKHPEIVEFLQTVGFFQRSIEPVEQQSKKMKLIK